MLQHRITIDKPSGLCVHMSTLCTEGCMAARLQLALRRIPDEMKISTLLFPVLIRASSPRSRHARLLRISGTRLTGLGQGGVDYRAAIEPPNQRRNKRTHPSSRAARPTLFGCAPAERRFIQCYAHQSASAFRSPVDGSHRPHPRNTSINSYHEAFSDIVLWENRCLLLRSGPSGPINADIGIFSKHGI